MSFYYVEAEMEKIRMTVGSQTKSTSTMDNHNYPGLYQCADITANSRQKTYFLLQKIYLGSLVIGGLLGIFVSFFSDCVLRGTYTVLAIVLAAGFLVLWVGRARQDDNIWFDCRAIAESVKTATWRYMMTVPPFHDDDTADQEFILSLKEMRKARPECHKHFADVAVVSAPAITDFMRHMRSTSCVARRAFYLEHRIRIQKTWYSDKAAHNARIGSQWFWTIVILQGIAVIVAIIQASTGGLRVNMVPVFMTCAAVIAAWSQMRRHDELKKTYALAAQELSELEALAVNLASQDFPQLVEQVEEAVSREHTMWCARRDIHLR